MENGLDTEYLLDRAFIAYFRYHKNKGESPLQPNRGYCTVSAHGIITLKNRDGVLAIYRYKEKTDRLIKMD